MRILLPPSEGKATPPAGAAPAALDELAFADALRPQRERLLAVLERLAAGSQKRALTALGLSPGQAEELAHDAQLTTAAAAPAAAVYTGVLYERLGLGAMPKPARRRAESRVLIASALWGFLRPGDRIPRYRCSAQAKLPRIGPLGRFWRPALAAAMTEAEIDREGELILDMRSGGYANAWRPRQAQILTVRAFTEKDGRRQVISHMAKATRGDVARCLLLSGRDPKRPEQAAALLEAAGHRVELGEGHLDLIEA